MRAQRRRRLQARDANPQDPQTPPQTALAPDVVPEAAPITPPVQDEEPVPGAGIPVPPASGATSSLVAGPVTPTTAITVAGPTTAPPATPVVTTQAAPTLIATVTMTVRPSVPAASGGGLSDGAAVGIGLAIVFVAAAACALGFICFRRRRRRVRGRVDPYASASAGSRAMPMEPLSARRSILKRPGAGPGVYSSVNDYSRLPDEDDETLPQYHARAQPGEKALPLSPTRDVAALDTTEILAEPSTRPIPSLTGPMWPFSSRSRSPSTDSTASTVTIRPFALSVQPPTAPQSANASAANTPSITPRPSRSASPSLYESEKQPSHRDANDAEDKAMEQPPTATSLLRSDTFGHSSSSGASTADSAGSEDTAAIFQEVRRGQPAQATTVTDITSVSRAGTILDSSLSSFGSTGLSSTSRGKETKS